MLWAEEGVGWLGQFLMDDIVTLYYAQAIAPLVPGCPSHAASLRAPRVWTSSRLRRRALNNCLRCLDLSGLVSPHMCPFPYLFTLLGKVENGQSDIRKPANQDMSHLASMSLDSFSWSLTRPKMCKSASCTLFLISRFVDPVGSAFRITRLSRARPKTWQISIDAPCASLVTVCCVLSVASPLSFLPTTLLQLSIAAMKSISGFASSLLLLAGMAVANLNILMTNDDGFGSANIRVGSYLPPDATELINGQAFKEALEAQGHSVLIVGPVRPLLLFSSCAG